MDEKEKKDFPGESEDFRRKREDFQERREDFSPEQNEPEIGPDDFMEEAESFLKSGSSSILLPDDSEEEKALERERQRLREERRERKRRKEASRKAEQRRLLLLLLSLCVAVAFLLLFFLKRGKPEAGAGENRNSSSNIESMALELYLLEEESGEGEALRAFLENAGGLSNIVNLHSINYEEGKEEELKSQIKEGKADLLLGEGSAKLEAFLEQLSTEEKIPYLSQSTGKLEPGKNHFVLEKSLEDQAVDIGFFAYNEAFRKMGILLKEGDEKNKALAEKLSESFTQYGGTVELRSYQGEEDFERKLSELETAEIDLLFLPTVGEKEKALLTEAKSYNILLGKDWDRPDFPGEMALTYSLYLYGRENKAYPHLPTESSAEESVEEQSQSPELEESPEQRETKAEEAQPDATQLEETQLEETGEEAKAEATSRTSYYQDILGILKKLKEGQKKSLLDSLENMEYRGACGEYHFLPGKYCLNGQGQFYELQGQERRDLNP